MDVVEMVDACRRHEHGAFALMVERYQNLALGYAFSRLGDFHRAQDVVQEAFVVVYNRLETLERPEAFQAWLRGIVHRRCLHSIRAHRRAWVPLEHCVESLSAEQSLDAGLQRKQERNHLMFAVASLPERQRTIVSLYYLQEQSQRAVAEFLELPISTVNNELHAARATLKGRLMSRVPDAFNDRKLTREFAQNIGEIIKVHGPLVDARIDAKHTPRVLDVLGSSTDTKGDELVVIQRFQNGMFRCLSTRNTTSSTEARLHLAEPGNNALRTLSEATVRQAVQGLRIAPSTPKVLETGIKVLDLFCPLQDGDTVGIFGKEGVGRAVLVMELLHRRQRLQGALSLLFYVPMWSILGTQDMLETEPGFATDLHENLQTAWIVHPKAGDPGYAAEADYLDASLYFSPIQASRWLWPAVDPVRSKSKALRADIVGEEHFNTAHEALALLRDARELTRDAEHLELLALGARDAAKARLEVVHAQCFEQLTGDARMKVLRGLLLEHYLTQPFYVAEDFTGRPGVDVPLKQTLADVRQILSGALDHVAPKALLWCSDLPSGDFATEGG